MKRWHLKADCVIEAGDSEEMLTAVMFSIAEALGSKIPSIAPTVLDRVKEGFIGVRELPISPVGGPNGNPSTGQP